MTPTNVVYIRQGIPVSGTGKGVWAKSPDFAAELRSEAASIKSDTTPTSL